MSIANSQNSILRLAGKSVFAAGFIAGLILIAVGCSRTKSVAEASAAPLEVRVSPVRQADVPIYNEWIGTLDGLVNADIKAQVSGYLTEQAYVEGTFVKKGQLLFQIDPRPFQAALDQADRLAQALGQLEQTRAQLAQAEAQVAVAEANQGRVQLDVDRYTPLAEQQAITQQDLDNAKQNNLAAKAQLQAARAQVATDKAQIVAANAAVQSAQSRRGNRADQPGIYPPHLANRRPPGDCPAAGRCAGESGRPSSDDGLHGRSDQSVLHRQRAGVSGLRAALPHG